MANIKEVASRTQNLYFQDYAETSQFWDESDFVFYTGAAYSDLLGQEYRLEYNRMQSEGEVNTISFSHDWLQTVSDLKREKDEIGFFVKLPTSVMSFPYDKRDCGLQNIFAVSGGRKGQEYVRSTISENWYDEFLPPTKKIFWALLRDKIYLTTNIGEPPLISKVVYVPGISDDLDIPDVRVWAVITNTIEMMRKAAANNIVKETANQNQNETLLTDADRNLIK